MNRTDEYAAYPILKQAPFPDDVTDFAIKAGLDSSGDPALWVWVIIKDEAADSHFSEKATAIREQVVTVSKTPGLAAGPTFASEPNRNK